MTTTNTRFDGILTSSTNCDMVTPMYMENGAGTIVTASEVQLAELGAVLTQIETKLNDIEEQLQEIFERLDELDSPYDSLRNRE